MGSDLGLVLGLTGVKWVKDCGADEGSYSPWSCLWYGFEIKTHLQYSRFQNIFKDQIYCMALFGILYMWREREREREVGKCKHLLRKVAGIGKTMWVWLCDIVMCESCLYEGKWRRLGETNGVALSWELKNVIGRIKLICYFILLVITRIFQIVHWFCQCIIHAKMKRRVKIGVLLIRTNIYIYIYIFFFLRKEQIIFKHLLSCWNESKDTSS